MPRSIERSQSVTKRRPKMQHHKPSGQAVVTINGRDHYLGPYRSRAASKKYSVLVREWETGLRMPETAIKTVAELVGRYRLHAARRHRRDGRPTSEFFAVKVAMRYLLVYHDLPIEEFGPLKLEAVRAAMVADGLARVSINSHVGRIRRAFRWAASRELIPAERYQRLTVLEGLRAGEGGAEPTKRLDVAWEAIERIRPHVSPQVWAMIQLQWWTGMRSGEVCLMRGCDIDKSGAVWLYRPGRHKTEHHGHDRTVALGPNAQAVLTRWLRNDDHEYLFQPIEAVAGQMSARKARRASPRWPSHDPDLRRRRRMGRRKPLLPPGERYDKDSYRRAITRALKTINGERHGSDVELLPHWTPHQLRHAFATRADMLGDADATRAAMGHAELNTTKIYTHADIAKAKHVVSMIG